MTNLYVNLADCKRDIGLKSTDTTRDAWLLALLDAASRVADSYTERTFYIWEGQRTYKTIGDTKVLWVPDLFSHTALTVEAVAWTENTDYELEPLNETPKLAVRSIKGTVFGAREEVKITGNWGYDEKIVGTGVDIPSAGLIATATGLAVDAGLGVNFKAGDTIRVGSEQMYLPSVGGDTLNLERGVNGTTAATHAAGTAIKRYEYPSEVRQAVVTQVMRLFRGRDAAHGNVAGTPPQGIQMGGISGVVKQLLNPLRRVAL